MGRLWQIGAPRAQAATVGFRFFRIVLSAFRFVLNARVLALAFTLVTACSSEPGDSTQASMVIARPCLAGIQVECACPDTSRGVQVCQPGGAAFGMCQCASGSAGAAGAAVPVGGAASTMAGVGGMVAGQQAGVDGASGVSGATGGMAGGMAGNMAGASGAAGMDPPQPAGEMLAKDLRIAEVAIYQAVKVSLATAGTAGVEPVIARNAPVIMGKDAFLRVFVEPLSGFAARDIEVVLTLSSSEGPAASQTVMQRIQSASSDPELSSTVNFDIPGDQITGDLQYAVALRDVAPTAMGVVDPGARFPATADELAELGARDAGPLRVTLVPYRYQGDGSGRLPVMEQAQLDLFRRKGCRDTIHPWLECIRAAQMCPAPMRFALAPFIRPGAGIPRHDVGDP
jgi:hypothetical protein